MGWRGEALAVHPWEMTLRKVGYAGVLMCMAGVVTAPALLSIGIVIIMLAGMAVMPLREQWRRFSGHLPAVFMSLLFALQLISGIWTREMGFHAWLEELKIKAPLFLGMYGLAVLGPFSMKQVRIALAVLLGVTLVVATVTVVDYYFIHYEEINHRIQISKEVEMWLGCNHIYFSIVMAFALLGGLWSVSQPEPLLFKGERYLIVPLLLMGFLEMHVLTTRTGLVGLYLTLVLVMGIKMLKRKRYIFLISMVLLLSSLPVIGYYGLASFRHRIDNSIMDVTEYFKGNDPNYLSIGTRIESWKTAFHLWQNHPLLGVGMADLKADMTDQYVEDQTKLCPENFQQPHNQFLQNLAGWGLVGFVTLCLAWFYPVLSRRWPKGTLFWLFWLNYTFAMMGESTMERQVGVCFLVPMYMLSLGVKA